MPRRPGFPLVSGMHLCCPVTSVAERATIQNQAAAGMPSSTLDYPRPVPVWTQIPFANIQISRIGLHGKDERTWEEIQ